MGDRMCGTQDTCSSSCYEMPAETKLFCPGPSVITSSICPTSNTCGWKCTPLGIPIPSTMSVICSTSMTCDMNCMRVDFQNPIAFPVGVSPWWQPDGGATIPGSIVDFNVYSSIATLPRGLDYGNGYPLYQLGSPLNVSQPPAW